MTNLSITIEDINIDIEVSTHAEERMIERDTSVYEVLSLIVKVGDKLLDKKDGEEFAVIDKECGLGVVCSINCVGIDIVIDVITVISNENIWISKGTKVHNISNFI